jgi:hypothetical protein
VDFLEWIAKINVGGINRFGVIRNVGGGKVAVESLKRAMADCSAMESFSKRPTLFTSVAVKAFRVKATGSCLGADAQPVSKKATNGMAQKIKRLILSML